MSLSFHLVDGPTGIEAKVSPYGELLVAPISYNTSIFKKFEDAATAYNFVAPIAGQRVVISSVFLYANKNVGAGDATVDIYEAASASETTIAKSLFQTEMVKQTFVALPGLNLLSSEGVWINGKTDDDDVFATLLYYYIKVV